MDEWAHPDQLVRFDGIVHTTSRPRIESKQRTSHHRGERRGWSRMLMADAMLDPRRSSRAQIVYRHPATLFVSATTKEFRHPPPLPLNRTFSPRPLPPPSDDSSFGIIGCVSGLHLRRYRCYTPFGMLRNGRRPHLSLSLSLLSAVWWIAIARDPFPRFDSWPMFFPFVEENFFFHRSERYLASDSEFVTGVRREGNSCDLFS